VDSNDASYYVGWVECTVLGYVYHLKCVCLRSIGMQLPWSEVQMTMASHLMAQFSSCVSCLQLRCQGFAFTEHDAISLLWQYYHLRIAAQSFIPSHVLVVVHSQFQKLPWESFFPTIDVLRSMVEVGKNQLWG
jgi:hypothetical protein